jgi:hypothetical protein
MKKLLVVLLALTCLSALSFADGVTVGMDFARSQFNIASQVGSGDIMQGAVDPTGDFPSNQQRIDIQLAWSSDHAAMNLTGYIGHVNVQPVEFVNAYGTLKLIPDMFKVLIGRMAGDGFDSFRWDSAHPIHDVDNNSIGRFAGWGIIADLAPKDSGLEVAVFIKDGAAGAAVPNAANLTIGQSLTNYDVAASYTLPNLLTIEAGSTTFATADNPYVSQMSDRNIFAGVKLLMVPNLTLFDTFWYKGFDVQPTALTIYSDELAASYAMGPLTIVLAVLYGSDNTLGTSSVATTLSVLPEVYYNLGALTVGLYGGYSMVSIQGVSNSGSTIDVEPYIKLNDFGLRVSFHYQMLTPVGSTTATNTWEIPVLIDWGF